MKAIYDEDTANTVYFEEKEQRAAIKADQKDERLAINKEKLRIRKIKNVARRQEAWNTLFPKPTYSPEIEAMVY